MAIIIWSRRHSEGFPPKARRNSLPDPDKMIKSLKEMSIWIIFKKQIISSMHQNWTKHNFKLKLNHVNVQILQIQQWTKSSDEILCWLKWILINLIIILRNIIKIKKNDFLFKHVCFSHLKILNNYVGLQIKNLKSKDLKKRLQ